MNQLFRRLSIVAFFVALVVVLAIPTTTWAASESRSETQPVSNLGDEPITSLRMRMVIEVSGDAFDTLEFTGAGITGMTMETAFTKIPPAAHMIFSVDENLGVTQDVEMIQIDGTTYIKIDGEWIDSPTEELGDINDVFDTIETRDNSSIENLDFIGNEMFNGRPVLHYRGSKEQIKNLELAGLDQNMIDVFTDDMTLQMDIWVDEARGFVTKTKVVVEGPGMNEALPDAVGRIEVTVTLYDFNADIVITAPVNGEASAPKPVLINEPTPEPTPEPQPQPQPEPTPQPTTQPTPELAPQPASAGQAPAEVGPLTKSIWNKVKK